jgi:hypothetical protein
VELRGAQGVRATLAGRWSYIDPLGMGVQIGLWVRKHDDEALHARMLGLLDALVAVGGEPPLGAPFLEREAVAR